MWFSIFTLTKLEDSFEYQGLNNREMKKLADKNSERMYLNEYEYKLYCYGL